MIGLAVLLAVALALLVVIFTALLAWEMRHPPRHTAGYAVARGLAVDPGELGLAFEEWTLERPDGVRLPVWEVRGTGTPALRAGSEAEGLTARSAVVPKLTSRSAVVPMTAVFVHGWGHSRIDALERIASPQSPFRTMCDRMVFYDLRGHGEAGGASRLGDDDEAGDLAALLERLGDGPFVLVGHSMGAVIAMKVAGNTADAGRTEEGTLTPSPSLRHRLSAEVGGSATSGRGGVVGVIAYAPYLDFHRSLCGRLRTSGYPARPMTDLAMAVHRLCGIQPRGLAIDEVQRIACPMLVIRGSNDCVASSGDARRVAGAAPDAMVLEFAGADHLDAHEIDRVRHDAEVEEFLARVAGA